MLLIAHRGNVNDKSADENSPELISRVIKDYHAEIDVWYANGEYHLGHDAPKFRVDLAFLRDHRLWCHAKNGDTLAQLLDVGGVHCFYHDKDPYTITSEGYIWTYPGSPIVYNAILNQPEWYDIDFSKIEKTWTGVCSDFVEKIRETL